MEFFVPLCGTGNKGGAPSMLTDLVAKLDGIFKSLFSEPDAGSEASDSERERKVISSVIEEAQKYNSEIRCTPSLSLGINIVYHKYPLDHAISEAHALLRKAKQAAYNDGTQKNSVCIHLRKHSGQQSGFIVHKAGKESPWKAISEYIRLYEDVKILHAIHHRLLTQAPVLLCLLRLEKQEREQRLSAWINQMQKESPINESYQKTLKTLLTALWDGREKIPEAVPKGKTEVKKAEEEEKQQRASEEIEHYINTLDGVFRFGELMQGWNPKKLGEKKKENDGEKNEEETRR